VSATLKACKKTAQGTALGNNAHHDPALKGQNNPEHAQFIVPFQGDVLVGAIPQGGALG
jgi:hypothetical protein